MKSYFHKIIFFVLIFVIGFLGFNNFSLHKGNDLLIEDKNLALSKLNTVRGNFQIQTEIQETSFYTGKCINYNKEVFNIKKYIQGNKLIFYLGPDYCGSCIADPLQKLLSYVQNIGKENIIILFNKIESKDFAYFMDSVKPSVKVLSTEEDISMIIPDYSTPILFVLNEQMMIFDAFRPLRNEDEFNNAYYESIKNKWF